MLPPKTTHIQWKYNSKKGKITCFETFTCIICALTALSSVIAPFRDILLNIAVVGVKGQETLPVVFKGLELQLKCQPFVKPNTTIYVSKNNPVSYVEDYYRNGSFYSDVLTLLQNRSYVTTESRRNGSQLVSMNICTHAIGKHSGAKVEYLIDGKLVAGALLFTGSHATAFPKRGTNFGLSIVAFSILNMELNHSSEMWYTKTFYIKEKRSDAMTQSHFIQNGSCAGYLSIKSNGCAAFAGSVMTESIFYFQSVSCAPANINIKRLWRNVFDSECKALIFYKQWFLTCLITAILGCLMLNRALIIFPIFIQHWRKFAQLDVDCLDFLLNDLLINIFQILSFIVNYPAALMMYGILRSGYTAKTITFLVLRITLFSNFASSVAVITGRILKVPVLSRSGTMYALCTLLFMLAVTNDSMFENARTMFSHITQVQSDAAMITWYKNVPGYSFYLQLWIYTSVFVYIIGIKGIGVHVMQKYKKVHCKPILTTYEAARTKKYFENPPCGILRNKIVYFTKDGRLMISGIAILLDGYVSINAPISKSLTPSRGSGFLMSVQAFRAASSNHNTKIKYRTISSDMKLDSKISTSSLKNLGYLDGEKIRPQLLSLK